MSAVTKRALDPTIDFDLNDPYQCRQAVRTGRFPGMTINLAPGFVQGNLAIVPKDYAQDFLLFCMRNPRPCPIIDVSDVGDPMMPRLGRDVDIRVDLSSYRVWKDGELADEVTNIKHLWCKDFVAFVLGCSLSFEKAMLEAQLPLRHVERGVDCPIYLTSIACVPAGPFHGGMIVSMRPFKPADAIRAVQVTTRFPGVHGAPVHIGRPDLIGIPDMTKQWGGVDPDIRLGEIPVFWACGVTPQAIVKQARPPICITHTPSHMIVTDIVSATQAVC